MDIDRFVFGLKYPHLLVLLALIAVSYFIFADQSVIAAVLSLGSSVYLGSFISGMLFSLAFTAPLGAGFWSVAVPNNIFVAALFGGLGTAIMDVIIFRSVKKIVKTKTKGAKKSKLMPLFNRLMKNNVARIVVASISFDLTGFLIGLPLPHKFEQVLISSVARLRERDVAIMSFIVFSIVALFFLSLKYTVPFAASIIGLS